MSVINDAQGEWQRVRMLFAWAPDAVIDDRPGPGSAASYGGLDENGRARISVLGPNLVAHDFQWSNSLTVNTSSEVSSVPADTRQPAGSARKKPRARDRRIRCLGSLD